ncbi:hypothetical protein Clacol_010122 [Clathrus columnatus]|uniref:Uncharacterized protein n=1 Tax=Clathrus columnatus TaxID=1419009 RepID=A0AAV5ARS0_9AGAM|nr:hypothetical protein Clacol_010122 [Clathrus columnatus]
MVSFTSLIVFAAAGLAVSASAVTKRDLASDVGSITALIRQFDIDVNATNPQGDPDGTTLAYTEDLALLTQALDNAAIAEEGQPLLTEDEIPMTTQLFEDFGQLIKDIETQVPNIQMIDGLTTIVQTGLNDVEDASAGEDKTKAVGFLFEILELFADVQEELSAPPSATA